MTSSTHPLMLATHTRQHRHVPALQATGSSHQFEDRTCRSLQHSLSHSRNLLPAKRPSRISHKHLSMPLEQSLNIANGVRDTINGLNTVDPEAQKLNIEFCHLRLSVSTDINEILLIKTGLNGISMALLNNNIEAIRGSVRHAAAGLQQMLPQVQDIVRSITQWILDPDWRWVAQWRALNIFYDCFSSLKARLAKYDKMYPGNHLTLVDELQFTRAQVLEVIKPQSDDDLIM